MSFSYNKHEKLKSRKLIKQLFEEGKSISVFPLRLIYLKVEHKGGHVLKTGVSVSKRNFKSAVDRIKIKRLMREAYRLNKAILYNKIDEKYVFMFIYLSKKEMEYKKLDDKMKELMEKFIAHLPSSQREKIEKPDDNN